MPGKTPRSSSSSKKGSTPITPTTTTSRRTSASPGRRRRARRLARHADERGVGHSAAGSRAPTAATGWASSPACITTIPASRSRCSAPKASATSSRPRRPRAAAVPGRLASRAAGVRADARLSDDRRRTQDIRMFDPEHRDPVCRLVERRAAAQAHRPTWRSKCATSARARAMRGTRGTSTRSTSSRTASSTSSGARRPTCRRTSRGPRRRRIRALRVQRGIPDTAPLPTLVAFLNGTGVPYSGTLGPTRP